MMFVATVAALTAALFNDHTKYGLVVEPSDAGVSTATVGGVVPLVEVVNPVLPGILAVTSTLGLVLLVTVTPLLGCVELAPQYHVLVVPLVLPLYPIAAARLAVMLACVWPEERLM
jgi:hypothetical protein